MDVQKKIIKAIQTGACTPVEIAAATGLTLVELRPLLLSMVQSGLLEKQIKKPAQTIQTPASPQSSINEQS